MKSYLYPENSFQFEILPRPDFDSFVALDFETTGLSEKSEIIEIGAVKIENGKSQESFSTLICPNFPVSPKTESITGLTNEILADHPEMREVFPAFWSFIGSSILVGHNIVSFDSKFLLKVANRYNKTPQNPLFDTLTYARKINHTHHIFSALNLEYLTNYFEIQRQRQHRALDDALSCAKLYFYLRETEKQLSGITK